MSFQAVVTDVFVMGDDRVVVLMTQIDGSPAVGDVLTIAGMAGCVVEVRRSSTDGKAVSTRACLTGAEVAPYGSVLVSGLDVSRSALTSEQILGTSDV